MTYHHIIFDLDGTLINPEKGIRDSLSYALEKMKVQFDIDSRFREFIGPPLHHGFMKVIGMSEPKADQAVKHFREYYSRKGLYESKLYPGIRELLISLAGQDCTIYLATSKLEKYAIEVLRHLEIQDFFRAISGASYKGTGADKQNLIKNILNSIPSGYRSAVCMIGDTKFDIEGAIQNGISSAGVLYGYGTEQELVSSGATHIVSTVGELNNLLTIPVEED